MPAAVTIILRSPLLRWLLRPALSGTIKASWYAKNARQSAGRRAKAKNPLGMKPDGSCTSKILVWMSAGRA